MPQFGPEARSDRGRVAVGGKASGQQPRDVAVRSERRNPFPPLSGAFRGEPTPKEERNRQAEGRTGRRRGRPSRAVASARGSPRVGSRAGRWAVGRRGEARQPPFANRGPGPTGPSAHFPLGRPPLALRGSGPQNLAGPPCEPLEGRNSRPLGRRGKGRRRDAFAQRRGGRRDRRPSAGGLR